MFAIPAICSEYTHSSTHSFHIVSTRMTMGECTNERTNKRQWERESRREIGRLKKNKSERRRERMPETRREWETKHVCNGKPNKWRDEMRARNLFMYTLRPDGNQNQPVCYLHCTYTVVFQPRSLRRRHSSNGESKKMTPKYQHPKHSAKEREEISAKSKAIEWKADSAQSQLT